MTTRATPYDDAPFSDSTLQAMRPPPLAKRARLKTGMGQEKFAATYGLSLATLRDWEQRRTDPDTAATAYLTAISNDPDGVAKAYNADKAA